MLCKAFQIVTFNIEQILILKCLALMGKFVCLMETAQQDGWKCATIAHGVQCVMTFGMRELLQWSADNLEFQSLVSWIFTTEKL